MIFLFIDESGWWKPDTAPKYLESDYFVLTGVCVSEQEYFQSLEKINQFKHEVLPENIQNIPLHGVDLNGIGNKSSRKNPYVGKITAEQGREIIDKSTKFMATLPILIIPIVTDTFALRKKYVHRREPYEINYEFILERFEKIVVSANTMGLVILASAENSETQGRLEKIHTDFVKNGTSQQQIKHVFPFMFRVPVPENPFLELADLAAYSVARSYRKWLNWKIDVAKTFADDKYEYLLNLEKNIPPFCGKTLVGKKVSIKVFPKIDEVIGFRWPDNPAPKA